MSSERFEYAGDELEGQLEKLDSALRQLDHVKDAEEARKRNKQVGVPIHTDILVIFSALFFFIIGLRRRF